jgi:hypothetical protein
LKNAEIAAAILGDFLLLERKWRVAALFQFDLHLPKKSFDTLLFNGRKRHPVDFRCAIVALRHCVGRL